MSMIAEALCIQLAIDTKDIETVDKALNGLTVLSVEYPVTMSRQMPLSVRRKKMRNLKANMARRIAQEQFDAPTGVFAWLAWTLLKSAIWMIIQKIVEHYYTTHFPEE